MQFSHVRVFSGSRNVQKKVTQIIYLGPLPSLPVRPDPGRSGGLEPRMARAAPTLSPEGWPQ